VVVEAIARHGMRKMLPLFILTVPHRCPFWKRWHGEKWESKFATSRMHAAFQHQRQGYRQAGRAGDCTMVFVLKRGCVSHPIHIRYER